jgi:2'-5' RNA ligase
MRLFIALDIDDAIRQRIQLFLDGVRGFAPDARWVRPESLHITLKFVGERSADASEEIKRALSLIRSSPLELALGGYGFFPTAKAPRVFWVGIESGPQLPNLAGVVDAAMAALGVPKEDHAFSAHLTLARGRRGSGAPRWQRGDGPSQVFQRLQEKLAPMPAPEFGTMTARAFFLYESQLRRGGPRNTKIARFPLQ